MKSPRQRKGLGSSLSKNIHNKPNQIFPENLEVSVSLVCLTFLKYGEKTLLVNYQSIGLFHDKSSYQIWKAIRPMTSEDLHSKSEAKWTNKQMQYLDRK
jgi:hypothetical protein